MDQGVYLRNVQALLLASDEFYNDVVVSLASVSSSVVLSLTCPSRFWVRRPDLACVFDSYRIATYGTVWQTRGSRRARCHSSLFCIGRRLALSNAAEGRKMKLTRHGNELLLTIPRRNCKFVVVRVRLERQHESPGKDEPMNRSILVGETVSFTMNTGVVSTGTVIQRMAERKQPVILLIEQANGWRCFRFEDEVGGRTCSAAPRVRRSRPRADASNSRLRSTQVSERPTPDNGDVLNGTLAGAARCSAATSPR